MCNSLIQELVLYKFEMGHNVAEAIKIICCTNGERTVTRWFKKFCLGCKNLNDPVKLDKPKTVDSETVLQAIEANLSSSTLRVSGELGMILLFSLVYHLYNLSKSI